MNKIKYCSNSFGNKNDKKFKKSKKIRRNCTILKYHVDKTFNIHNGKNFVLLTVNSNMVGHRFGEFCLTIKERITTKKENGKTLWDLPV